MYRQRQLAALLILLGVCAFSVYSYSRYSAIQEQATREVAKDQVKHRAVAAVCRVPWYSTNTFPPGVAVASIETLCSGAAKTLSLSKTNLTISRLSWAVARGLETSLYRGDWQWELMAKAHQDAATTKTCGAASPDERGSCQVTSELLDPTSPKNLVQWLAHSTEEFDRDAMHELYIHAKTEAGAMHTTALTTLDICGIENLAQIDLDWFPKLESYCVRAPIYLASPVDSLVQERARALIFEGISSWFWYLVVSVVYLSAWWCANKAVFWVYHVLTSEVSADQNSYQRPTWAEDENQFPEGHQRQTQQHQQQQQQQQQQPQSMVPSLPTPMMVPPSAYDGGGTEFVDDPFNSTRPPPPQQPAIHHTLRATVPHYTTAQYNARNRKGTYA